MNEIPIYHKVNLTIEEAAALTNIGTKKIRELAKSRDCNFALHIGARTVINREKFIKYLDSRTVL